jgi:hypothetical protein
MGVTDTRDHGRITRRRHCLTMGCDGKVSTVEITLQELREWEGKRKPAVLPLCVPVVGSANIEQEMEDLLPKAIEALKTVLDTTGSVDKARADTAWRIVEDRRTYRRALAEQEAQKQEAERAGAPESPLDQAMSAMLQTVPSPLHPEA